MQVADQVDVCSRCLSRLCLLMQQVGDVHVPEQEYVLVVGDVLAGLASVENASGLGPAPGRSSQPPEVEDEFGDVFPAFGLCYVHADPRYLVGLIHAAAPARCLKVLLISRLR